MKRLMSLVAVAVVVLALAAPALAASLGVSPSKVEVQVPADGSATADFQVYYFSGDVKVSLVNIPLRVEPDILHVNALDGPVDIQLTIFGDTSLGSQVYNGFIKFTGMSGEMIAIAVQVRAAVTNLVAGEEPVQVAPATTPATEAAAPAQSTAAPPQEGQAAQVSPPGTQTTSPGQADVFAGLSLNLVIIIAGGLVFIGLVILAISLARRRRF
jgi:hypothetical protein